MSDLISREALLQYPLRLNNHNKETANIHFFYGVESVIEYAESLPIVEAKPVVHGRWFALTDCSNAGVYCSACAKKVYNEEMRYRNVTLLSKYCPNCGAKMDRTAPIPMMDIDGEDPRDVLNGLGIKK